MTAGLRIRDAHSRELLQMPDSNYTTYPPLPPSPVRQDNSYFSRSFNSNVVVVMAVLLFALVVAAFINTVARCIMRRRRPLQPEDHNNPNKGLDKSVIEALPVVTYGADSLKSFLDPAGGTECVVCLSEFSPGEKIRLLPDCHHGFHLACIDTWLLTHTTCPVCRRGVLPASPCCDSDSSLDPARAPSARFGSSRFGSARIASVDIEIEPTPPLTSDPGPSSSTGTRTKRPFGSILSTEAMVSIIGSRRFGATRNTQHPV